MLMYAGASVCVCVYVRGCMCVCLQEFLQTRFALFLLLLLLLKMAGSVLITILISACAFKCERISVCTPDFCLFRNAHAILYA